MNLANKEIKQYMKWENSKYVYTYAIFNFYSFGYSLPNHFFIDIVHVIIMH